MAEQGKNKNVINDEELEAVSGGKRFEVCTHGLRNKNEIASVSEEVVRETRQPCQRPFHPYKQ